MTYSCIITIAGVEKEGRRIDTKYCNSDNVHQMLTISHYKLLVVDNIIITFAGVDKEGKRKKGDTSTVKCYII